ncbi:Lrp/AsnC family transcriptional regulator [Flavihumibacter stibioxidans]|uniref:AsnC family transcriptional regulator n=1 Tax=Flavihumibacter stibioxidans TaxID=1834163 RepID=A0ABR7MCI7_9BACT|nr:Lrp/AsnC family transcriptional regulator [Flavihumibacter stibioxidans]MBC6492682.1 AsnC family transcriptional regulator [Flavihumibacter stibioxidans]
MEFNLDNIDLAILEKMQANARISNADLARELSMAPSAILERVKKLEQKDVIRRYTTAINPAAIQQKLLAFIFLRSSEGFTCCSDTAAQLAAIPEVQEVHHIAGEDCYLVKVRTTDASSLMSLMRSKMQKIPNIASTKTTIVLETVKEQPDLVIPKT